MLPLSFINSPYDERQMRLRYTLCSPEPWHVTIFGSMGIECYQTVAILTYPSFDTVMFLSLPGTVLGSTMITVGE